MQSATDYKNQVQSDMLTQLSDICMNACAKKLSQMLERRADISLVSAEIMSARALSLEDVLPAVATKVYMEDFISAVLYLFIKRNDAQLICQSVFKDNPDNGGNFLLNRFSEVVEKITSAAAAAVAMRFGGSVVTPGFECFLTEDGTDLKALEGRAVVSRFRLKVRGPRGLKDMEFVGVMSVKSAQEIKHMLNKPSNNELETRDMSRDTLVENAKQESAEKAKTSGVEKQSAANKDLSVYSFADLRAESKENAPSLSNLNIIMDVPMEVVIQIGKTKKQIKEIIEFTQGSIIELEKQAGDPVDIIVNGELIARGDVIVIDDNFGVRITEIVNK